MDRDGLDVLRSVGAHDEINAELRSAYYILGRGGRDGSRPLPRVDIGSLVLDLETERWSLRLGVVPEVPLAIEELKPLAQAQVAVEVERGMFRIVDPRVDTDLAAERPEQGGNAELRILDARAELQVLRTPVDHEVVRRRITEIVRAKRQMRLRLRQQHDVQVARRSAAMRPPGLADVRLRELREQAVAHLQPRSRRRTARRKRHRCSP